MSLSIILAILAGILLAPYGLVPLVIRYKQSISAAPDFQVIDAFQLPERARDFFQQADRDLISQGFEHKAHIRISGMAPDQYWFLSGYYHPVNHDSAAASDMLQEIPDAEDIHAQFIEFNSMFKDDSEISTTNSDTINPPGGCESKTLIQIPLDISTERLYNLHGQMKLYYGQGQESWLPDEREILEKMQQTIQAVMQCICDNGYQYLDHDMNAYRPTWKGAFILGWSNLWPVSRIIRAQMKHRASRILKIGES